jgi:chemotaxis protein CheD
MHHHFLYPGTLFVSKGPARITTILGSCVSVCLWDRVKTIGGINHYINPLWNGDGLPTPRYGNVAITRLYEQMQRHGSDRGDIVAKVFGGARMYAGESNLFMVGSLNIQVAWDILDELTIPVAGYDVGGQRGRKLVFDSSTGLVTIYKSRDRIEPTVQPGAGE